ncbi:MAG: hypothetical protein ACRER2_16955 [Methylococcales bacterium]
MTMIGSMTMEPSLFYLFIRTHSAIESDAIISGDLSTPCDVHDIASWLRLLAWPSPCGPESGCPAL